MIFISYRKEDAGDLALSLAEKLKNVFGNDAIFLDEHQIEPGDHWRKKIERALSKARVVLAVIGRRWLTTYDEYGQRRIDREDDVLAYELSEALQTSGIKVIPLYLHGLEPMRAEAFPKRLVGLAATQGIKFDIVRDLPGLLAELEKVSGLLRQDRSNQPSAEKGRCTQCIHQLPPLPPYFTNRVKELAILVDAIRNQSQFSHGFGSTCVVGIRGMPGIGKTALALRLAHQITDHYPDAQMFIDMQGYDSRTLPRPVTDALAHCIRSFKPESSVPENNESLRANYLSVLRGRRCLLLCDNVAPAQNLSLLLPPSGCMVILTSRDHLDIDGLELIRLDTLERHDSIVLLRSLCSRLKDEPPNVLDELAARSGDISEALRVNAGTLTKNPFLSAHDLLEQLRNQGRQAEPLRAALNISYEHLDPNLRRYWRCLAVFHGDFSIDAAAAVWGVNSTEAMERLGRLEAASLVQPPGANGRVRLHDLLRTFADVQMDDTERRLTEKGHTAHYTGVLKELDAHFLAGGAAMLKALQRLDADQANIEAAAARLSKCFQTESPPFEDSRGLSELIAAGPHILEFRVPLQKWMSWLSSGLLAAQQAGERSHEGWHLAYLGLAQLDSGKVEDAHPLIESALKIARELGETRLEGESLSFLGISHQYQQHLAEAYQLHLQARELRHSIGDRRGEANDCTNLGVTCPGTLDEKMAYFHEALRISREIRSSRTEAFAQASMASVYYRAQMYQEATACARDAVRIRREIGDIRFEVKDMETLIETTQAAGNVQEIDELVDRLSKLYADIASPGDELTALCRQANLYAFTGKLQAATQVTSLMIARVNWDQPVDQVSINLLVSASGRLIHAATMINQSANSTEEQIDTAIQAAGESRRVYSLLKRGSDEADALFTLGYSKATAGSHTKSNEAIRGAVLDYTACLELRRQLGDCKGEAAALGNLGDAWQSLKDWKKARAFSLLALAKRRTCKDLGGEGLDLANLAIDSDHLGQRARAIILAQHALPLLESSNSPHTETVRTLLAKWRGNAGAGTENEIGVQLDR